MSTATGGPCLESDNFSLASARRAMILFLSGLEFYVSLSLTRLNMVYMPLSRSRGLLGSVLNRVKGARIKQLNTAADLTPLVNYFALFAYNHSQGR